MKFNLTEQGAERISEMCRGLGVSEQVIDDTIAIADEMVQEFCDKKEDLPKEIDILGKSTSYKFQEGDFSES